MWVDAQIGIGQMMRGRAMSQSIWRLRMNLALEPSKALALPATEPHLRSFKTPRLCMALCFSNSKKPIIWWLML